MKKYLLVLLAFVLIPMITSCGEEKLVFFNYGEYIDEELITAFEQENNVKVITPNFTDSSEAYEAILVEAYDIVVPSDYIIERLAEEDLIEEIDWSRLSSFSKNDITDNLKTQLTNLKEETDGFDLLKYSVPYFWGNFGIIYDSSVTGLQAEIESKGWGIMKTDMDIKIGVYDSPRDILMVALKELGYNSNTTDEDKIDEAEEWLKEAKSKLGSEQLIFTDERMLVEMLEPRAYDVGFNYTGDCVILMQEDEDLEYYVPDSGTNIWIDGMVIPKNAKNIDLAYKFIDFITTYDAQLANTEWVGYATCSQAVFNTVYNLPEGAFYGLDAYAIPQGPNDETFRHNVLNSQLLLDAYSRFKND